MLQRLVVLIRMSRMRRSLMMMRMKMMKRMMKRILWKRKKGSLMILLMNKGYLWGKICSLMSLLALKMKELIRLRLFRY
jgi:hypothetical protein